MSDAHRGQTLVVSCRTCGRTLGHVVNYGRPQGAGVTLPCPCGGVSHPIRVSALYRSVPDGAVAETSFGPGLERAIETARRQNDLG